MSQEEYYKMPLEEVIRIDKLITIHYFEFASNYVYTGEKHDFWEMVYVDKGEIEVMADTKGYCLKQGDMIFHKPEEFHSLWANGRTAPNIIIVSFESTSAGMKFFEDKIISVPGEIKYLLADTIKASRDAFANDISRNYSSLVKREEKTFGAEQLVKINIELFLIMLARENNLRVNKNRLSFLAKERVEEDLVESIIAYLKEHLHENFNFEEICLKFSIGKTQLKTIFKSRKDSGVMTYFRSLKIEEAKRLMREKKYNFTEISEILGFESVHYFSRCFKKHTDMSPSEYSLSVKARTE